MFFRGCPLWLLPTVALLYECNAQNGQADIPSTATGSFPEKPDLVMQGKQPLDPGVIYANPKDNPFNGNLLLGPITPAKLSAFKDNEKAPEKICTEPGQGLNKTWDNLLQERLFPNGTVQQVGFSRDILPFLDDRFNKSIISEITRGRFFDPCDPKEKKKNGGSCDRAPKNNEKTDPHRKRIVFSPDERQEVLDTRGYPFVTIGVIGADSCTGTLIGPRHVLTAGHCVHSGGGGNWFGNLDFTLIKRAGAKGPVTTRTFKWSEVWSVKGWTKHSKIEYDYALIILDTQDTGESWLPFGYNTAIDDDWSMNLVGYPCDKPSRTMWRHFGRLADTSDLQFLYYIDTFNCQSGSAVYWYRRSTETRIIYGVHGGSVSETSPNFPDFWNSHTNTWNRAARINKARFKQICGWMKSSLC